MGPKEERAAPSERLDIARRLVMEVGGVVPLFDQVKSSGDVTYEHLGLCCLFSNHTLILHNENTVVCFFNQLPLRRFPPAFADLTFIFSLSLPDYSLAIRDDYGSLTHPHRPLRVKANP